MPQTLDHSKALSAGKKDGVAIKKCLYFNGLKGS
jgi:hypothetical protein